ncbi:hypothetical protein F4604DRAFT_1684456 [Suillus subluteus]|nr:hypothetical protein F4604DRAFT_1684456 [Suillus subluteus]
MPVDMHDMELQAKNSAQPHVPGIISDLISDEGQMAWHRTTKDSPLPEPVIGIQFWMLFFHKIMKSLCSPHDMNDYNAETLTLYPGDVLFLEDTQGNNAQAYEYADETVWQMDTFISWLPPDQLSGNISGSKSAGISPKI